MVIYTGSGLMGREIVNIRSSDIVIVVGGHSGTLGEFAIAYDKGKLIGVLQGTGGIADIVPDLVGAIDEYVNVHFQHPSVFMRNGHNGVNGRPRVIG